MPGSHQYDPGSRSLSHQRLPAQARELITESRNLLMNLSLHAIYKCLGIKKTHAIVLPIGSEMKEKWLYIHFVVDLAVYFSGV